MKRKVFNFSLMASIGLLAFGVVSLSACNNNTQQVSISLSKAEVSLAVGENVYLSASYSKGAQGSILWFSSNENVALVDKGYVIGISPGNAVITATIGGAVATCNVTVTDGGGGGPVNALVITPTSKSLKAGESFTITYTARPEDTTVEFASNNNGVATVTSAGLVTAVANGSAKITVNGSNGLSRICEVTISDDDPGPGGDTRDIAVDTNLNYTGKLNIGSPLNQTDFMKGLLADFNTLTHSSIEFTVTTFEEDNGTTGYKDATSMPALFPYASDQTMSLYQYNALSAVSKTDTKWIKDNMGDDAFNAAKYSSNAVGYPFAADNGVVMFYSSSVVQPSEIETLDQIFALAEEKDYDVDYAIGNGFYAAGALMTFTEGKSLYTLTPSPTGYNSSANFDSEPGIQGARLIRRIANEGTLRKAAQAPSAKNGVLVTITDASKVQAFKRELGSDYAVAPLPFVDAEKTTRLGSYLGYKFYGVNNTLNQTDKEMTSAVAKFLCSEYAQAKRFDQYNVRPTLTSLADYAAGEQHIAALATQQASKSVIALTAIASELWSASETAVTQIKVLSENASDAEYHSILETLDGQLTK